MVPQGFIRCAGVPADSTWAIFGLSLRDAGGTASSRAAKLVTRIDRATRLAETGLRLVGLKAQKCRADYGALEMTANDDGYRSQLR